MLELNPYPYASLEAQEYERDMAKRSLEMVAEAAAKRIAEAIQADSTRERLLTVVVEASEAVVLASEKLKREERAVAQQKETEGN